MAQAQDADDVAIPASKWGDTIGGDWGGVRSDLDDKGIDLNLSYGNEFAANASGGTNKDATAIGQVTAGVTLDMDKIAGFRGGSLHGTITYRHGPSLVDKAGLDTLQLVQEAWGRGQTWRLTEFYWDQQVAPGVDIKAGRLTMGSDFESLGCDAQNLTFCGAAVGNLVGDYWYNWPVSQWGAVGKVTRRNWYAMAGVYEANTHNLDNNFALNHAGADGVTVPVEFGWIAHLGAHGLPGVYKIGGWYNTQHADDLQLAVDHQLVGDRDIDPLRRKGRYGAYIAIRQQLTGTYVDDPVKGPTTTSGLSIQLNYTQADRRTARTDDQVTAAAIWTAPFAGRPEDDVALFVGRTNVNARAAYAEQLADPRSERAHAEYVGEFYYSLHLMPGVMLRPNVQYIVDPGGYRSRTDEVILGLKSAFTL
ncbi:carbohydrate porin [Novosphingobium sp. 9]|uniref:carbohydrate porin n=1 Tax=Novosphingobium sp. 9 TaxID=2025349 RepID=UPI0021B68BB3|nr:carbohydrate porin [Novosphingobium sp. 9]